MCYNNSECYLMLSYLIVNVRPHMTQYLVLQSLQCLHVWHIEPYHTLYIICFWYCLQCGCCNKLNEFFNFTIFIWYKAFSLALHYFPGWSLINESFDKVDLISKCHRYIYIQIINFTRLSTHWNRLTGNFNQFTIFWILPSLVTI